VLLKLKDTKEPWERGEADIGKAVGPLVELVGDGAALPGSDNYVGLHAVHALRKIAAGKGTPDSYELKDWQAWWRAHRGARRRVASGIGRRSSQVTRRAWGW
jgi:hypothetical protein